MHKLLGVLIAVYFGMFLTSTNAGGWKTPKHDEVEKIFIGNDDKIARDAYWASSYVFKVAVIDEGTRRDEYAMYVCQVLQDHDLANGTRVQVVDFATINPEQLPVTLGAAKCDP